MSKTTDELRVLIDKLEREHLEQLNELREISAMQNMEIDRLREQLGELRA